MTIVSIHLKMYEKTIGIRFIDFTINKMENLNKGYVYKI